MRRRVMVKYVPEFKPARGVTDPPTQVVVSAF